MKEIDSRVSVRKYKNQDVEEEKLRQVLEAARLAPSGKNSQPWKFIVVRSNEKRGKIAQVDHRQKWMLTAPVFIVCVADVRCRPTIAPEMDIFVDEESSLPELKQVIRDTSIAIEHILLEAERLGLRTCWTGWFEQKDMRPILNIPKDKYVCGVVTLGYGDEKPEPRPRKKLDDILCYETWE